MSDGLPLQDEELAHIFSFLDWSEKRKASLVCKRWIEVFNTYPRLLENVCVDFVQHKIEDLLSIFSEMTRNFRSFYFQDVFIDEKCLKFFRKFENQFRSLSFNCCEVIVRRDQPGNKLQNCTQLYKLKVSDSDALEIFSRLPALKSLHLEINRLNLKLLLEQMQEVIPLTLREFQMDNFHLKMRGGTTLYPKVEEFIQKRRLCLKSLGFKTYHILDVDMDSLSKVEGLRLKRFKLSGKYVLDNTIESFCKHQREIVILDLEEMIYDDTFDYRFRFIKDSTVEAICTSLPHLEELSLRSCSRFNESVAMIFQLKHLRRLNLYKCKGISDASFRNALNGLACNNLKILNLCHTFITRSTISRLTRLVPSLREVTLSHSHFLNHKWIERLPRLLGAGMKFVRRPEK